jgi:hypothetical protein
MVNELYTLAKTLDREGVSSQEWHREYKKLPNVTAKAPCIRIWLGEEGTVCGLESLPSDLVSTLRKYGNKHQTFPAFSVSPLYRLTEEGNLAELEKVEKREKPLDTETIRSWCQESNWRKSVADQVQRCLKKSPAELMERIGPQAIAENTILLKLVELCQRCAALEGGFRASLENCIFEKLQKREEADLLLKLLFHKGSAEKGPDEDIGDKLSVILDVQNWRPYGSPVASEPTTLQLNRMLLEGDKQKKTQGDTRADAFGTAFVNPKEPMPSVWVSGFDITVRSMFKGQPCQVRYHTIEDGSYPIAKSNRTAIKTALEWIADPSHKQITWERIDKDELVFVYPSKLPKVPQKFASLFQYDSKEKAENTAERFKRAAEAFIKSYRGLPPEERPDSLQIFSVRKMDKARSKVVFTHPSTPERLICAAKDWQRGCRNLPKLGAGGWETPFPLEVAEIVNCVWKQDGERASDKKPVKHMKGYQGMELLLDILPQGGVRNFLHTTVVHASGLIYAFGNQLHRGERPRPAIGKAVAQICSVLGLLLFKCEQRKENYMEAFAYLMGQLLHVSDELHTLYCLVKRNRDIPPQLAGSGLFVTAGEVPYQALAQLSVRMNPYVAWAKQYRHEPVDETKIQTKAQERRRARWLLRLFERISDKIKLKMDKGLRFGDYEKAQLFIGYMAALPEMAALPKKDPQKPQGQENKIAGGIGNEQ